MSDATATILQTYGKPYEFSLLDRKVVVCTENDVDEQNDPSLYSLVRAWVRNGYIPAKKVDTEASPPFSLPPSQPAPQEKLEYPDECFTKSYVKDETDVSNLASVYKTAWIATHSTYTAFKAKRRRRHETRHSALLAVAQQNQKSRLNKPPKPPPSAAPVAAEPVAPPQPATARPVPLAAPPPTATKATLPGAEDLLRSHNLTMRSGSTPLANTPQPLEKRASANGSRQSPSSFGVGYMAGVDSVRQAHNLADRGTALPAASASPAVASGDPKRTARVPGPVNLADMHLRATHGAVGADGAAGDAGMPRGGSPSCLGMARPMLAQPDGQRLPQPTKAQLQAHIHAQAQAQVRAQLEAAQAAAAAAAEAAQGDAAAGAPAAPRGPLSAAKLAGPMAAPPGVAPQPGPGPTPLRDRREQVWRGRDLGRQFGAMLGRVPGAGGSGGSFGGGNGEEK